MIHRPHLALDLGSKTGFAWSDSSGKTESGTWKLAPDKLLRADRMVGNDRLRDCRYCTLVKLVCESIDRLQLPKLGGILGFEDVQFSSSTAQTQLWASFRTAVWLIGCQHPTLRMVALPVGTLKKFATGNGNATKEMMIAALPAEVRAKPGLDDNEADAYHLLSYLKSLT